MSELKTAKQHNAQFTGESELLPAVRDPMPVAAPRQVPSSLEILDAAVRGGVTSENVAVVKEIIAMRREEVAFESKAKFNRAFFELKSEIATMNFYADKSAKNDSGVVCYSYCSEKELASKLDPVLFKHGFTMLFGQRDEDGKQVAVITLIHKDGHEETREYSVRAGGTNRMKDATAADTGATTSAWRHLVMKMFGLKSRIQEGDDPRNLGETNKKVTPEQAGELEHQVKMLNRNVAAFLKLAGAATFGEIPAANFPMLERMLKSAKPL
jgi:hypothetical protein